MDVVVVVSQCDCICLSVICSVVVVMSVVIGVMRLASTSTSACC